jgi:hypothetical protein
LLLLTKPTINHIFILGMTTFDEVLRVTQDDVISID